MKKLYNKKGFLEGIVLVILATGSFFLAIQNPDHNTLVQTRNLILSVVLLLAGLSAFVRAFSKKATVEDLIEAQDERNLLIRCKSKARMLDIVYGVLFVLVIGCMIGAKITANEAWIMLLITPAFLLGLFFLLEIFVTLYYEKHT